LGRVFEKRFPCCLIVVVKRSHGVWRALLADAHSLKNIQSANIRIKFRGAGSNDSPGLGYVILLVFKQRLTAASKLIASPDIS
jgi:hypothetical protein